MIIVLSLIFFWMFYKIGNLWFDVQEMDKEQQLNSFITIRRIRDTSFGIFISFWAIFCFVDKPNIGVNPLAFITLALTVDVIAAITIRKIFEIIPMENPNENKEGQ